MKDVSETIKNEVIEQRGWLLSILLGTLDTSLFRNLLTDKNVKTKILRQVVLITGEGTIRLDQDFYCRLIF